MEKCVFADIIKVKHLAIYRLSWIIQVVLPNGLSPYKTLYYLWSESDADLSTEEGSERCNVACFTMWWKRARAKEYVWHLGAGKGEEIDCPLKLPERNIAFLGFSPEKPMSDFSPTELYHKIIDMF